MNEQSYMTAIRYNMEVIRTTVTVSGERIFEPFNSKRESSSLESPSYITRCLWEENAIYWNANWNVDGQNYFDAMDEDPYAEVRCEYERDIMADIIREQYYDRY
jgi:hypothetical protein